MSLRVLVVDDERCVAGSLQAYLEDEGMRVQCAGSAEEALELIRDGIRYDVCIMDMRLPGMNGDAAIRNLHLIDAKMKFIIHTGTAEYAVPDDLRAIGVSNRNLFMKPLRDMAPLVDTIRNLKAAG